MKKKALWSFVFMTAFFASAGAKQEIPEVKIHPDYTLNVNGYRTVQPIFNGNFNGSLGTKVIPLFQELQLNGARAYFWINLKKPYSFWAASQFGGKPAANTKEGTFALQKKWANETDFAAGIEEAIKRGVNHPFPSGQMGQLKLFQMEGMEDSEIVFHHQMDGIMAREPKAMERYFDAYIKNIKKYGPFLKKFYVMPHNEPNYADFAGEFSSTSDAVDSLVKGLALLTDWQKKTHPEVPVIGPCFAGGVFNWQGWDQWYAPFLARWPRKELENFVYQVYCQDGWGQLAWMSMIQAKSEMLGRKRPQIMITETNYGLGSTEFGAAAKWMFRNLFMGLENPDKLKMFSIHLAAFHRWAPSCIVAPSADGKIEITKGTGISLLAMNKIRGELLGIQNTIPGLHTVATRVNEKTLTFAAFNDSDKTILFRPSLNMKNGLFKQKMPSSIERKRVDICDKNYSYYHFDVSITQEEAFGIQRLPPGSMIAYTYTFAEPYHAPSKELKQTETFANIAAVPVASGKTFSTEIRLKELPEKRQSVLLRFAVTPFDVGTKETNTITNRQEAKMGGVAESGILSINGKSYTLFWNESLSYSSGKFFYEIPLEHEVIRKNNEIKFHGDLSGYRVMFLSFVVKDEFSENDVKRRIAAFHQTQKNMIRASIRPLGRIRDNEKKDLVCVLSNNTGTERTYEIKPVVAGGIRSAAKEGFNRSVTLKDGETKTVKIPMYFSFFERASRKSMMVEISSKGFASRQLYTMYTVFPKLIANKVSSMPTREQWNKIPALNSQWNTLNIKTSTQLAWSPDHLYFRVRVEGKTPFRLKEQATMGGFFTVDCLEFFLDLHNRKNIEYEPGNDMQLFLTLNGGKFSTPNDQPNGGYVDRRVQGDWVNIVGHVSDKRIRAKLDVAPDKLSYTVTGEIAFSIIDLAFKAKEKSSIGLNISLTDVNDSLIKANGKCYLSPAEWCIVDLK